MKFEYLPEGEAHKFRITFEAGEEAETLGSAYRERVSYLYREGKQEQISPHELEFSKFDDTERRVLVNDPESIAVVFDEFCERTEGANTDLAWSAGAPFKSDDIAHRTDRGEVARKLAVNIRGLFRLEEFTSEIEEHGPAWFTSGGLDSSAAE
jgi:hypothetical protein